MRIELRPYQVAAVQALREEFLRGHRRVVIVAPTGAGKTIMFCAIVASAVAKAKRVIVIAHRKELVDQTVDKLARFGIEAGVVMGDDVRRDSRLPVQVCSIQTLARRLDRLPPADIVVYDEVHHAMSNSSREVLSRYGDALHIGATATPWRKDKLGLRDLYESSVLATTPAELIRIGALVPYEPYAYDAPDLHEVGVVAGEFNQRDLGLACNTQVLVGSIVREYQRHTPNRSAIVFPVNIEHSKNLTSQFASAGFTAAHLDCFTPKAERESILEAFQTGEVRVLSSVGVLTEGFDAPRAEVCVLARPTKSLSLYIQMVGRVLRTCEGKSKAIIHDHAGNMLRHGLPDEPRDYSLDATPERTRKLHSCSDCNFLYSQLREDGTCPKCGSLQRLAANEDPDEDVERKKKEKTEVDGRRIGREEIEALRKALERVDLTDYQLAKVATATRQEKAAEYLRLKLVQERKGFKPGFVAHQYRQTFGVWPKFSDQDLAGLTPASRPFLPLPPRAANDDPSSEAPDA